MIRVKLPGMLEYRDLAIRMVASACKLVQAQRVNRVTGAKRPDPEFDGQVISAFGEAFNNVALHSYQNQGGDIEIEIELTDAELVIRVLDYGKSFDASSVPQPDLDTLPESGLGIFIMRGCMDDVCYVSGPPNVLTMKRNLVHDDDVMIDDVAGK